MSEALLKQYDSLPSSKEYPQHAASSLLEIGVSIFFFSAITLSYPFILNENESYQKSKKFY